MSELIDNESWCKNICKSFNKIDSRCNKYLKVHSANVCSHLLLFCVCVVCLSVINEQKKKFLKIASSLTAASLLTPERKHSQPKRKINAPAVCF